ncbi:TspO/MBR family protein [Pseudoroseicyclus sp. H15]
MTQASITRPRNWLSLALFIIVVVGVGSLIGVFTAPDDWYAALDKPFFNPPNWLFGPVWTVLYICVGVAGWRTWQRAPRSGRMGLWGAQLVVNWFWSPVFFSLHLLWPALAVIALMWVLIVAFIWQSWRTDRVAAWLFVPYLAWVSFASLLNLSLAILN